ncbi:MAG: HAMP domain-containing protein [Glaciimonas sp.]|nr:HAMP domain-containing protein [Glaciimonas sp.]
MNNFSISTRLSAGFAAVLILMLAIAGLGISRLQAVGEVVHTMSSETMAIERLGAEWFTEISVNSARTVAVARTDEPESQEYFKEQIRITSNRINTIQKSLEPMIASAGGKALLLRIAEKRTLYATVGDTILELKRTGRNAVADQMIEEKFLPAVDAYLSSARQLIAYQQNLSLALATQADRHFQNGRILMASLSVAALLLGLACAWLISRSISVPLHAAVRIAQRVAAGDLSAQIVATGKDETGQLLAALRDMNTALHQVIGDVRFGVDTIALASGEIATGNADLSSRTEEQASALEETASSMEQLTATVHQNADNARQATQLAVSASSVAVKGGQVVSQVVDTMGSIKASSRKIADIISVIDGISFQTNILALNAAVEAAHAGEQGRGFAVVASEVRNLAQRSASAAKEIKALIDDSVGQVDQGSKLVDAAGQTMSEIVSSVQRVADIMSEITAASQEQSAGIEQVNQAIGQMDEMTQQNAALVEQAAAAAESLQGQAKSLAQAVSVFKLSKKTEAVPAVTAFTQQPPQRQQQRQRAAQKTGSRMAIDYSGNGPESRFSAALCN